MKAEKPLTCALGTLCACGCGRETRIATRNIAARGTRKAYRKGEAFECVRGHRVRKPSSYLNRRTGIGTTVEAVHRTRAAIALGKPLPKGAVVHHADGSRDENAPLVICQDAAYHNLLHARMRVLAAGGDPNKQRICSCCRRPLTFGAFRKSTDSEHRNVNLQRTCRECQNDQDRKRAALVRHARWLQS